MLWLNLCSCARLLDLWPGYSGNKLIFCSIDADSISQKLIKPIPVSPCDFHNFLPKFLQSTKFGKKYSAFWTCKSRFNSRGATQLSLSFKLFLKYYNWVKFKKIPKMPLEYSDFSIFKSLNPF